jgi:hypothetical protein
MYGEAVSRKVAARVTVTASQQAAQTTSKLATKTENKTKCTQQNQRIPHSFKKCKKTKQFRCWCDNEMIERRQ